MRRRSPLSAWEARGIGGAVLLLTAAALSLTLSLWADGLFVALAVAVVVVVAVAYLTISHPKHVLLFFGLAVLALSGAWFSSGEWRVKP